MTAVDGTDAPDAASGLDAADARRAPRTRAERTEQRFEKPMLVVSALVIPAMIVQNSDVGEPWHTAAAVLDWGIWLAFVFELVVMLTVVPNRRRWLLKHPIEVVVVFLTPPFFIASLQSVRGLRLLRLVRLLRLKPLVKYAFSLDGLKYAALIVLLTVLAGGAAFDSIESEDGFANGLYLAVNVATTLGFGQQPTTTAGKAIAVVLVFTGISFIALLTGAIADRFVTERRSVADEQTVEIYEAMHTLLAEVRSVNERLDRLEDASLLGRDGHQEVGETGRLAPPDRPPDQAAGG